VEAFWLFKRGGGGAEVRVEEGGQTDKGQEKGKARFGKKKWRVGWIGNARTRQRRERTLTGK